MLDFMFQTWRHKTIGDRKICGCHFRGDHEMKSKVYLKWSKCESRVEGTRSTCECSGSQS